MRADLALSHQTLGKETLQQCGEAEVILHEGAPIAVPTCWWQAPSVPDERKDTNRYRPPDYADVGRKRQHMLGNAIASWGAGLERPDHEGVSQRVRRGAGTPTRSPRQS